METEKEIDQIEVRKEKIGQILELQKVTYPNQVTQPKPAHEILNAYHNHTKEQLEAESKKVVVAGRIQFVRDFGKGAFWKCKDHTGMIQLFLSKKDISKEGFELGKLVDLGDLVHISGTLFRTQKGELTLRIEHLTVLAKCLRPLPEKFHGLADIEIRHRQRYLDLIMNPESFKVFGLRSRMISDIRRFFTDREFLEVETPILQTVASGALAKPFTTHHNALGIDLKMRIAPELYLKRLLVGGYPRVFEMGRNFRNEGISKQHNPEFTMLEFYQAYATYEELMTLIETLCKKLCEDLLKTKTVQYGDETLSFDTPFQRLHMFEALAEHFKTSIDTLFDLQQVTKWAKDLNIPVLTFYSAAELAVILFEHVFEQQLQQPTFVQGFPVEVSPLARRSDHDPRFTDRFELYIASFEVANGFSELNDPKDQLERFEAQAKAHAQGNEEALPIDMDFIEALSYGMPPTAGAGIGIDRLVMTLTNQHSIRDVILFPTLRPDGHGSK